MVALFARNWSYALSPKALEHRPGEKIGPFTLERALGRGAAAEVWLAVESSDLGFTKRQALKLLEPPEGELEEQKEALLNEARVCGLLKHPGIVDVYKVDSIDDELFIAMEFVDGPDLNTLLHSLRVRQIALPVGAALEIAIELCEALEYAHNARDTEGQAMHIIHRDLKPSNVLVDRNGVLKITDWGLVKSHVNIGATTRGVVKGTPGYIAPEVWGGTREFKPTGDLFAVGAILYEAIRGERLFQGRNLGRIAQQVARRNPREEAELVEERCPSLVPILEKLLQRHPEDRYARAAQVISALRAVRDQYPSRESFKAFVREHADLFDEIAPRKGKAQAVESKATARHAETVPGDQLFPKKEEAEQDAEDSLWDGSMEDGEVEEGLSATEPIPVVTATRAMPQVQTAGAPSGTEIDSLTEMAGNHLLADISGPMDEHDPSIQDAIKESQETAPGAESAKPAGDSPAPRDESATEHPPSAQTPPDFDDEEEITQVDDAVPIEEASSLLGSPESAEEPSEPKAPESKEPPSPRPPRKRSRQLARRKQRHLQGRLVAMLALIIAIVGVSLLLAGLFLTLS